MFILASGSPSRKEILQKLHYQFSVCISHAPEFFLQTQSAEENAMRLALLKAKSVALQFPDEMVIGCDTIQIDPNGKLLEKPKDADDAKQMMNHRSGKIEKIVSGIALVYQGKEYTACETSFLHWKTFEPQERELMIKSGEWEGKCGGIAIEGISGLYLEKLDGSIANVMGFPLNAFWKLIYSHFGNDSQHFLYSAKPTVQ